MKSLKSPFLIKLWLLKIKEKYVSLAILHFHLHNTVTVSLDIPLFPSEFCSLERKRSVISWIYWFFELEKSYSLIGTECCLISVFRVLESNQDTPPSEINTKQESSKWSTWIPRAHYRHQNHLLTTLCKILNRF